jgi:hypothetical protein
MGHYNHTAKDCNLLAINAFAISAVVMLLVNFIVEKGLYNGAVGKVIEICYHDKSGPQLKGAQPAYIVVDFSRLELSEAAAVWDLSNPTHVLIPCFQQ